MQDENNRQKKQDAVKLKQYVVSGSPAGARRVRKAALILQTCPRLANDEFLKRFPDCAIWNTGLVAESDMTKEDLEGRDFWKDGLNWTLFDRKSDDEPLPSF